MSDYETEITYTKYDDKGNIQEALKRDNTYTTFIWGYNQNYLVARLDNIRHSDVVNNTVLMDYINQLQNYTAYTTGLVQLNRDIRNALPPNVQITTCTYRPLIGMTTMTDPAGVTSYFEYDSAGRLQNSYSTDDSGEMQPVQSYEYHFQNQ